MGMIYFIRIDGGPIKVGFTADNPQKRLVDLQVGSPWPLRLVGTVLAAPEQETDLHEHESLAPYRMNGEWFRDVPSVVETMTAVLNGKFDWEAAQRPKTPFAYIRKVVLKFNQEALAQIIGCDQATISRWERGIGGPDYAAMTNLREEILRRNLPWDDSWFFRVPAAELLKRSVSA